MEELFNHLSSKLGKEKKEMLRPLKLHCLKELDQMAWPLLENMREGQDRPNLILLQTTDTDSNTYAL